jgi:hypothetical protein
MGDAIDMALDQEGDVEASDQVVNQVLSEIGIEVSDQIGDGVPIRGFNQEEEKKEDLNNLESRFNNLK